MTSTPNIAKLL